MLKFLFGESSNKKDLNTIFRYFGQSQGDSSGHILGLKENPDDLQAHINIKNLRDNLPNEIKDQIIKVCRATHSSRLKYLKNNPDESDPETIDILENLVNSSDQRVLDTFFSELSSIVYEANSK